MPENHHIFALTSLGIFTLLYKHMLIISCISSGVCGISRHFFPSRTSCMNSVSSGVTTGKQHFKPDCTVSNNFWRWQLHLTLVLVQITYFTPHWQNLIFSVQIAMHLHIKQFLQQLSITGFSPRLVIWKALYPLLSEIGGPPLDHTYFLGKWGSAFPLPGDSAWHTTWQWHLPWTFQPSVWAACWFQLCPSAVHLRKKKVRQGLKPYLQLSIICLRICHLSRCVSVYICWRMRGQCLYVSVSTVHFLAYLWA